MNKVVLQFLMLFMISGSILAQTTYSIKGHFPNFPNSNFELRGYDGLQDKVLSSFHSQEDGKFILTYPKEYKGVAQLWMNGAYAAILFLNQENFSIFWEDLTKREAMQVAGSKEFEAFTKGMKTFQQSEAKVAGWHYIVPLYEQDSIKYQLFTNEFLEAVATYPNYVKSLPENLWVRHYLLAKGLIEQMPNTVKTFNWRAHMHMVEFNGIDFRQHKNSGLIKEVIEGYTNLVEWFPIEEVYPMLEAAIDKVVNDLADEPTTLQAIAQYWFTLLESKSLTKSAEFLALKMLNQDKCVLDDKSIALFEQYRKLAIGQTVPPVHQPTPPVLRE